MSHRSAYSVLWCFYNIIDTLPATVYGYQYHWYDN